MAFLTMTYSFTNSTTADATQVNTNFTDVINATSDGTKDLNVNALTAAGAAVLNGNVTLGSGSTKDLTINASLAASVPIKTTRTYDIGSADLGLRILYLGGNSTHTAALQAPSSGFSGDTTFALPVTNGVSSYVLKSDGSGNTAWTPAGGESTAGSDADTVLTVSSARVQIVVPTAARAYTLPTTSVWAGDEFTVINNAALNSGFNVTVKSSDGTALATAYPQNSVIVRALQATPTGITHWQGMKTIVTEWQTSGYVPTFTGLGTPTNIAIEWRRIGDTIQGRGRVKSGTVSGSTFSFNIPTGFNIDTAKMGTANKEHLGTMQRLANGQSFGLGGCNIALFYDGNANEMSGCVIFGTNTYTAGTGSGIFASTEDIEIVFEYPVSGWTATKG